jgi:hypothetical protein
LDQTDEPSDLSDYQRRKAAMGARVAIPAPQEQMQPSAAPPADNNDVPDDVAAYMASRAKIVSGAPKPKPLSFDDLQVAPAKPEQRSTAAQQDPAIDLTKVRTPLEELWDSARPETAPERQQRREIMKAAAADMPLPKSKPHVVDPMQAEAGAVADTLTLGNADRYLALPHLLGGMKNYEDARQYYREALNENRQKQPLESFIGDAMGMFTGPEGMMAKGTLKLAEPVIASASKINPLVGFLTKTGVGAGVGAESAAIYGATTKAEQDARAKGEDSPDLKTRIETAKELVPAGAALGGAAPAASVVLRPAARAVGGGVAHLRDLASNVGAQLFPDIIDQGTNVAQHTAKVAAAAARRELARNGIITLQDFLARAAKYGDKPVMTGEMAQGTLNNLVSLTRGKGTTAEKAQAILEDRVAGLPGRMLKDIADETGLPVNAIYGNIERMIQEGQARARPVYEAAMNQPFAETTRLQQLAADSPALKSALAAADTRLQNVAAAEGRPIDSMPPLARYDEAKKVLDSQIQELIEKPHLQGRGASIRDLEMVRSNLVDELDRISAQANTGDEFAPLVKSKYAEARAAGADAPAIDAAFKEGKRAINLSAEEVEREVSRLTGQPLTGYQSGVVQDLVKKVEKGTLTPRRVKSDGFRKQLRSVFGEAAADGLISKFGIEAELSQKGSRINPNVGAVSSQALMGTPSKAGDEVVKAAANVATGNKIGLVMQLVGAMRRAGYSENELNAIGDILLASPRKAADRLFPGETPPPGSIPPPPGPAGRVRENPTPTTTIAKPPSATIGNPIRNAVNDLFRDHWADAAGATVGAGYGGYSDDNGRWSLNNPFNPGRAATGAALGGLAGHMSGRLANAADLSPLKTGSMGGNAFGDNSWVANAQVRMNPSKNDIAQIIKAQRDQGIEAPAVRLLKTRDGTVYAFDGYSHTHHDMTQALGLKPEDVGRAQVISPEFLNKTPYEDHMGFKFEPLARPTGMQDYNYRRKLATSGVTRDPETGIASFEGPRGKTVEIDLSGRFGQGSMTLDGNMSRTKGGERLTTPEAKQLFEKTFAVAEREAIRQGADGYWFMGGSDAHQKLYRHTLERLGAPRGYIGIYSRTGQGQFGLVRADRYNDLVAEGKIDPKDWATVRSKQGDEPVPDWQRLTGLFALPAAASGLGALANPQQNAPAN